MKELSIKQKAKAYDDAIERAKAMIKVAANQGEAIGFANTIFPELKKSEDERIKKEIIDFICWATDRGCITKEQREKSNSWLAWLEKQGEQKQLDYEKAHIQQNDFVPKSALEAIKL